VTLSRRLLDTIRHEDPDHLIFIEGTDYSRSFDAFKEPWPGTVYSVHDYSEAGKAGGGPYPGVSSGSHVDRATLERTFLERAHFMLERGLPIWVAELGAVFDGQHDADRYRLLDDQLSMYERHGASWSLCTYKDIGVMALRTVKTESAYVSHFHDLLDKKERLGSTPGRRPTMPCLSSAG
jgi:endoglucanase